MLQSRAATKCFIVVLALLVSATAAFAGVNEYIQNGVPKNTTTSSSWIAQSFDESTLQFSNLVYNAAFNWKTQGGPGNRAAVVKMTDVAAFYPNVGKWAVLTYKVPVAGFYNVDAAFSLLNQGADVDVLIFADNNWNDPRLSQRLWNGAAAEDYKTFISHIWVDEYLRFAVDAGTSYYNDNLGMSGQITTAAPEPGTMAALGAGIVALLAKRRKK